MTLPSDSRAIVALPASGKVELLFLLFHGVGGEAANMAPLAQALRAQYPQAAVVSLTAPLPFDAGTAGFQWFSVVGVNDENRAARVEAALPDFIARVRQWGQHFELDWGRVALAGFSQGAIMSLAAVQAEPQLVGRVIAFAGRFVEEPGHAPQDVCVHLLHGTQDAVIPYQPTVASAKALVQLGADVTADVLPGIGHELHPTLVERAMEQLRTFVPAKLWREAMRAAEEQGLTPPKA